MKAEAGLHFAPARFGDGQSAAVEILNHPFSFQGDVQESRTDRAADVRPPLAPVHTGVGKTTPQPPLCARPDYEGRHRRRGPLGRSAGECGDGAAGGAIFGCDPFGNRRQADQRWQRSRTSGSRRLSSRRPGDARPRHFRVRQLGHQLSGHHGDAGDGPAAPSGCVTFRARVLFVGASDQSSWRISDAFIKG